MIQTAAIIWAVLATVLGIAAGIGWRAKCRDFDWAIECWRRVEANYDKQYFLRFSAQTRLAEIDQRRHLAAKKARAAQLAQRAALVASTTEQIRKEIGR